MAERRMFAKTIIDSDAFLDMPVTARLLYYDLAMRADDDGFVNSPKKIMRMVGASQDDLSILILRKFIIPFDNGVVVIKHWRIHNFIRNDRYKETTYTDQKGMLELDSNKAYQLKNECHTTGIPMVDERDTQVRLGKVSIGKVNKKENKKEKSALDSMIDEYTNNPALSDTLRDYIKLRKALKAPLTDRAMKICLNKLDTLATTDEGKIKVVEQSIERGWKGLFPLKQQEQEPVRDIHNLPDEELSEIERIFKRCSYGSDE